MTLDTVLTMLSIIGAMATLSGLSLYATRSMNTAAVEQVNATRKDLLKDMAAYREEARKEAREQEQQSRITIAAQSERYDALINRMMDLHEKNDARHHKLDNRVVKLEARAT